MKFFVHTLVTSAPTDSVQLRTPHLVDNAHYVNIGGGLSVLVTTVELADWIEKFEAVLADCRLEDLRAAMQPLPEVAE